MLKLKIQLIKKQRVLYNFFWDTNLLIEYNLSNNVFLQKEVLFECDIPKYSKVIVCPHSTTKLPSNVS